VTASRTNDDQRAAIALLLHHVGRMLHNRSFSAGLNPAQWNALRYLASANAAVCTVSAFAGHHMTSKGTASETFRSLAEKGLIVRLEDPEDRRVRIFRPTPDGRALLDDDPILALKAALGRAARDDLDATARVIEVIVRSMFHRATAEDLD
jgi:DNA-binding MarR family transcriptional regulator